MAYMEWPEWAGYCAAFDAFIDARQRHDDDSARMARTLMTYFAEPLSRHVKSGRETAKRLNYDLRPLLDHLGLS